MYDLGKALKDKLNSMSIEEVQALVDKVESKGMSGPTVNEYFTGLQSSLRSIFHHDFKIDSGFVEMSDFTPVAVDIYRDVVQVIPEDTACKVVRNASQIPVMFDGNDFYPIAA